MSILRNVAIIAHVDHGKTTLVDAILRQTRVFRDPSAMQDLFLDSNELERERGITILSKNVAVNWRDARINIIDTPGHGDFGGQVERVLNLADGVLLLVDAFEGPMPQTRFVLEKALSLKLTPIVVINKIDKPMARPHEVHDEILELFMELEASNEQMDFPTIYASGRLGWASMELDSPGTTIAPLLDLILERIPAPTIVEGPVQMQITTLDCSDYVGRIGIGRVKRGELRKDTLLSLVKRDGTSYPIQPKQIQAFEGIGRIEADVVQCGDLCAVAGVEGFEIGDTIADREAPEALPPIKIDEPTLTMIFRSNDGPLFGQEGKYVTSRQIRERLYKELERDTAIRVEDTDGDALRISGRGVLHLSILIETMRREGFEMTISQPQVIMRTIDGRKMEPIESLTIDVPAESANKVMELVGSRRGELVNMELRGERQRLIFRIPTRGIVGLKGRLLTATAGEAVMAHVFDSWSEPKGTIQYRQNGVMISMEEGESRAFAIDALQARGVFFIGPNEMTYEGMIVGENSKAGDMVVNVLKSKQLTNVRASGSDRAIKVIPPRRFSLEDALEYISDDELVEVTPKNIRLRKRYLKEHERKKQKNTALAG